VGFFPIGTFNLFSLKRRRDSDFKTIFVIMKREISTQLKIFLAIFSLPLLLITPEVYLI
jgi:hypothetical protein